MQRIFFSSLQKRCEEEILLTQEVYTRLSGFINLCAYNINERIEYGEHLFGYYGKGKILFYSHSANPENVAEESGAFRHSDAMVEELIEKMYGKDFNCFASVHTHPSNTASGMAFSAPDIRQYQREKYALGTRRKMRSFGCMMSIGPRRYGDDAIAFVSCNDDGTISYYPNIGVIIGDQIFIDNEGRPHLNSVEKNMKEITILRNVMA